MPITHVSFAVRTQNKDFLTLHKQANPKMYIGFINLSLISVHTNAIKACVNCSCSMCIFTQCISIELRKRPVFAQRVTYSLVYRIVGFYSEELILAFGVIS